MEKKLANEFSCLVNSYSFDSKKWVKVTWNNMLTIDRNTFSAMAVAWLKHLGNMDEIWTDMRNHASWVLGHQLKEVLDHIELNVESIDVSKFAEYMSREHRTLQQSFTRLCMAWFYYVKEQKSDLEEEQKWIQIANTICKNGSVGLPFV